jgi:thermitase
MQSLKITLPTLVAVFAVFITQNIYLTNAEANGGNTASAYAGVTQAASSGPDRLFPAGIEGDNTRTIYLPPQNSSISNDPYNSLQWELKTMQAPDQRQLAPFKKRDAIVAILDTGIDTNHEDIQGKVTAEIDLTEGSLPNDLNGHGTHIAGIIAAGSNNGVGITGLAPEVRLLNVKVADANGSCQANIVAKGIIWAVDSGARIINVSLEFNQPFPELENAINYAWQQGCLVIASASNQTIYPVYPAFYKNCLAVAATDEKDQTGKLSYDSNWIDVAAPGFSIFSTLPGNNYGYRSGTSFATAQVSGLAAILYSMATDNNEDGKLNDEVREAILKGAQKTSSDGIDRINFMNSITIINSGRELIQ